eukprot:3047807-Pleurochrysis_carterae.AAC.1
MNPTSVLSQVQLQKWRCFLCYFSTLAHRLAATPADPANARHVHFERLVADTSELDFSTWASDESPLCAVDARPDGLIEEAGAGALQLDFANKMVGGGVLRNGCVQEEIRFLISPELVVARLLAEKVSARYVLWETSCYVPWKSAHCMYRESTRCMLARCMRWKSACCMPRVSACCILLKRALQVAGERMLPVAEERALRFAGERTLHAVRECLLQVAGERALHVAGERPLHVAGERPLH